MRYALIAVALVACSAAPVAMDGSVIGDAGGDAALASDASPAPDAFSCSDCIADACHPAFGSTCTCRGVQMTPTGQCRVACAADAGIVGPNCSNPSDPWSFCPGAAGVVCVRAF